ncbi:MAG: hypothetical protein COZ34_04040 [Candidatus Pacebacteria bacterium CG_4_10_14_3_um_filter_34_15]|nr:MAG: hypothetical protein AUJ41_02520 [Candidatus Pacebacteria bacterium CG1_02_43_31]PIQ80613.1 MAG: hypothetical protein COV78_04595 [Candidatus Pacebacteria bacterium CG11_big_fil_rev_8_21_14_0_20_34_55]PIX81295.1 MAG: hypothetical protein COZ34_04040 [Candidatus Pacebacteria bacterium CG_4_10_14_3_um_filter_34_15]PJC43458.1 MAG: hypothetical protein CO039_04010 [Candidatus Pacebacteria bacterium CG_4_9_14_0_2_um_filter_34_50]
MFKIVFLIIKLIWQNLIEIIFPCFCINCGKRNTLLCCNCYEQIEFFPFNFDASKQMNFIDEVIIVCKYRGVVKKLIHDFKYKSVIGIGDIIAKLIYRSVNIPECDFLVPIPIHKNKKSKRGFNQSEEMIKSLSKLTNIPYKNLLIKQKNTKSQMSIRTKEERKINLKDSFTINYKLLEEIGVNEVGKTVMLVDDVLTTGSTLDECAKILKANGIKKVIGLALAQR